MRTLTLLALLLITGVTSTAYWFSATAAVCPVPLSYRIGELDERFAIGHAAARAVVVEAATVWESATDRDLFRYDESADFTINFVFDERQERATAEVAARSNLDAKEAERRALAAQLTELREQYTTLEEAYATRVSDYEARLAAYNAEVESYNERGGAPSDVFAELTEERDALDAEATALEASAGELNRLADEINALAQESNDLVAAYNEDVAAYNARFTEGGAFNQAEYLGDRINVYKFTDAEELQQVMVHEFGHALGIGHVDDPRAMMYYLLEEQPATPTLTQADLTAFRAECGTGEELSHQLRRLIRSLLAAV